MLAFEKRAMVEEEAQYICGCDEAGRGALAGPVVASAVYIPQENYDLLVGVNDSKQLSSKKRLAFFETILHLSKVGIGVVQADEIDCINIYQASRKAMLLAVKNLQMLVPVDYILTDAMPLPASLIKHQSIIKGDQKSLSIAAASIVAKCIRDNIMIGYDERYPQYQFAQHKGYGTKKHLDALASFGVLASLHRKSYKPVLQAVKIK